MENKVKWASDSQAGFYSIPDQIVQRSVINLRLQIYIRKC